MDSRSHSGPSSAPRARFSSSKTPYRGGGSAHAKSMSASSKPRFGTTTNSKPASTYKGGYAGSKPASSFKGGYAGSKPASSFKGSYSAGKPASRSFGRPSGGRGSSGGRGRFGGERIDFARFVKKAEKVEAVRYVSQHTFMDFPFVEALHANVAKKGYIHPTPIQDQAILSVMKGVDVFGLANTGTGKTAAFLLPLIDRMYRNKEEKVLVLAPTRELALQIEQEFRDFTRGMRMFSVACVGGAPIGKQVTAIKLGVSIVIGTPGRVVDLIKRKVLDFSDYKTAVLDEADRMLDMGFKDDLVFILSKLVKERQTLFFSATLSADVKRLVTDYMKDPKYISVVSGDTSKNIDQDVIRVKDQTHKIEKLHELLIESKSEKVLIFRETKHSVDQLEKELRGRGFKVGGIHGDKRNRERVRMLESFKRSEISILIATDVAARGLDIPNVSHVVNYDIPSTYDTYVHRIGRTGRADKKGIALTFVPESKY